MIKVKPATEPDFFDAKVRRPGKGALLELIGSSAAPKRPGPKRRKVADRVEDIPPNKLPDLWRLSLDALRAAYHDICGYLGMRIHPSTGAATVDHFLPKNRHQAAAYEWSNFRLAARQVNTNKGDHEDVLDPFEIDNGWFALGLGDFKVRPAPALDDDPATKKKVEDTIARLKLNEPTFCESRREYHDRYHGLGASVDGGPVEPLPLAWLEDECPYVAWELRRQARLRSGDD